MGMHRSFFVGIPNFDMFPSYIMKFKFYKYIHNILVHSHLQDFPPQVQYGVCISHTNTFVKRFMHIFNAYKYSRFFCCTSKLLLPFCNILVSLHDHLLFSTIVQHVTVWATGARYILVGHHVPEPHFDTLHHTPRALNDDQYNNMTLCSLLQLFNMRQYEQLGLNTYLLVTMCQTAFS